MKEKQKTAKEGMKLFLKSAFLTAIGILLVVIGFVAAGYFIGG